MSKVISCLKGKEMQKCGIVLGVMFLFLTLFAVNPFATDGYEDIGDRTSLDQRVASAISNGQTELYVDYSGEDFANMKNWFKDDFKYDKLINYTDEFSIYNYNGAKYTYWSYGDKKRVKVNISYKLTNDQIASVNTFVDNYINNNGLRNVSKYEAIKTVHDYLVNNYTYVSQANNVYEVINNKQANCYGYTMLNYVILNKLGIPVRTTYGAMNDSHIWNAVQLDGQWYYEDVTWDTVDKGTSYFLVSTNEITKNHTIYGNFIPNCPSNYVPTSPKTDEVVNDQNNENNSSNKDSNIEETPKQDDSKINESTKDNNVKDNIDDSNKNESNTEVKDNTNTEVKEDTTKDDTSTKNDVSTKNDSEKENPSSSLNNGSDNTSNSNTSNSATQKENKTQKLMKLLKLLKRLFKK